MLSGRRVSFPYLDLPVVPPFAPMEARLDESLPALGRWQYEPKWDGLRCLLFKRGRVTALQSKSGQPLARYFPEIVEALEALEQERLVLDGELVVPAAGGFSFEALLQRIHPAERRIRKLAAQSPAAVLVFDLLVDGRGRSLLTQPLEARRAALEAEPLGPRFTLSPATRSPADADRWLAGGAGTDGVVAKRLDEPYRSGERTAMVKVKRERTADCVVAGFRRGRGGREVGSVLLGLYGDDGLLHYAGHAASFTRAERVRWTALLEPLCAAQAAEPAGFTGGAPGGPSRWARERSIGWTAVPPVLVVEVAWRHASGGRFRHGVRVTRLRPDKAPRACTADQLRAPEDAYAAQGASP